MDMPTSECENVAVSATMSETISRHVFEVVRLMGPLGLLSSVSSLLALKRLISVCGCAYALWCRASSLEEELICH